MPLMNTTTTKTFSIDDGNGNRLIGNLDAEAAMPTAESLADSRGEAVYLCDEGGAAEPVYPALDPEDACPGCGCAPGDGVTESCDHVDGCGHNRALAAAYGAL